MPRRIIKINVETLLTWKDQIQAKKASVEYALQAGNEIDFFLSKNEALIDKCVDEWNALQIKYFVIDEKGKYKMQKIPALVQGAKDRNEPVIKEGRTMAQYEEEKNKLLDRIVEVEGR